jgi:hypothetical protein
MIIWKSWTPAAALLAAACIAGCGGGGGGSGGRDDLASRVIVSTPTASNEVHPTIVGEPLKLVLNGTIKGDYERLQGKTVYVTVEDSASMFLPNAEITLTSTGNYLDYRMTLNGRAAARAERLSGSLRIYVCLDRACETRLGNSPMTVPYSISVQSTLASQ